jgi:predicted DNA-binding antitoxin AbrB/MazE fold protein
MVLIVEQGKVNNGGIVLSKPLSLPEGTEVRIQIEPIASNDGTRTDTSESNEFANLPCFGMWAEREEMRDSVAWVKKEREKWKQRYTPTE